MGVALLFPSEVNTGGLSDLKAYCVLDICARVDLLATVSALGPGQPIHSDNIVLRLRFGFDQWEVLAGDSRVRWEEGEARIFILPLSSLLGCNGLAVSLS